LVRVLLVPSSDYLGHPFPQRHNQIFERLQGFDDFEGHVVRFRLFDKKLLATKLVVHELDETSFRSMATYYLKNMLAHASEIRRIVKNEGIDVVVLSNIAAPLAYILMDDLRSMHVPAIFDLPDYYPTSAAGCISDVRSPVGKLFTGTFDLMLRYIIRRASLITAASSALVDYAKNVGAHNAINVPNGISSDFLKVHDGYDLRQKLGFEKDDLVVGYLGSVEFWLDMRNLIRGVSLADKKGLPVKLLLIGKGLYTEYPTKVKNWIKNEGLTEQTMWLDFVPYDQVPTYLSSFSVGTIPFDILNPTAYYSAPNKLWEYMSQMTPVISTGIPEAISNKDCLSIASTPQDYTNYFISINQNSNEVLSRVSEGHSRASSKTWENSAKEFMSAICQLTVMSDR
jgi:glycosyltransferase involved in cell wall biosynthesis